MQVSRHIKIYSLLLFTVLSFGSPDLWADDSEQEALVQESLDEDVQKRGYLSVPSAVGANCDSLTVELLSTGTLGNTTTNLCRCKLYKIVKSVYYTPAAMNGCPMMRMTASGATLDLCHMCVSFCRSDCTTHCIGLEVGYSPQAREDDTSLTQPNSVIIENGIMSNWDIAILIHSGVKNVVIRNMVFTGNVLPIVALGQNDENGVLEDPVCSVHLENVSILGSCNAYRACLDWIRAFLSNGTLSDGVTSITETSLNYVNGEVMPCVCDPIADDRHGAFVYTGLYTYGATDVRLKNVNVSNIGFSGNTVEEDDPPPVPAVLAERTATYGLWFRDSKSVYLQDVASVKNKSSLAVAGAMFDGTELISVKNAQFAANTITQQQAAIDDPQFCFDGLWAAGIVFKDSNTASFCDVVLSENQGVDNAWGFRTQLSAIYDNSTSATTPSSAIRPTIDVYSPSVNSLMFENVYADSLRADRVYGFDFGDMYRHVCEIIEQSGSIVRDTAMPIPAGSVRKLDMKNVTVCGAKGKIVSGVEEDEVAEEFKGIFLGDESSGICIDGARIGSNAVVLDESCASQEGINSGIEFGSISQIYEFSSGAAIDDDMGDFGAKALAATGKAKGAITDVHMNDLKISDNTGGSGNFRFVGIRAVATGSNLVHTPGTNVFSDINITNSYINANQFDGLRAVDDVPGEEATPITLSGLCFDNVTFNSSIDGYGMNINNIASSVLKNIKIDLNNVRGFHAENVDCVDFFNVSASNTSDQPENLCGATITEVYGFDVSESATSLRIDGGRFNKANATDADVAGFHVECGNSVDLKNVQANCNESTADAGDGPYHTRGIYFETKINNLGLVNVDANGNVANNGNVYGIQVDRATSVHACSVRANNNQAEGEQSTNCNVSTATGMFFKATVGSKSSEGCLMKDLQACGNTNAHLAYGIHMQEPIGLVIEGIDGSSNVSNVERDLLNGSPDPALLPMLSQAIGIYFEGGAAVHMSDVHASANHQTEQTAAYLSRHLQKGFSIDDSEANKNETSEIAHHFPVANRSGAYGIFADGTQDISIEGGSACNNSGVRAFGVHARGVDNFCIHKFDALENYGTGSPFFDNNPFNLGNGASEPNTLYTSLQAPGGDNTNAELDPENLDVADAQAECNFGGIDPATKVDMKTAYEEFLKVLAYHKSTTESGGSQDCSDPCGGVTGSTDGCIAAHLNLLWASLAPCRRFSTGVGIGMYNSNYAMIEDCRAMGNWSLCDSAGGFVFYGKGEGHTILKSTAANNEAYKASERGGKDSFHIDGDIDFTKWQTVYTFMDVGLLESETVFVGAQNDLYGFESIPLTIIKSDHIDEDTPPTPLPQRKPTALTQPEGTTTDTWTLDERHMTVGVLPTGGTISGVHTDLYDFVSVGPIGVGILLECQRDCNVADNNVYGNKGHAGLGFGILSDSASSSMFIDNRATSNSADVLGYAWGLADFTMSSPNIWYKNWMYANRVDTFMNSSYLIVFDNALSGGQTLPVKTIFPGSLESLVNSLPFENIVIRFVSDRQEYDCVGDLITDKWISSDALSCGL